MAETYEEYLERQRKLAPRVTAPAPSASVVMESERLHNLDAKNAPDAVIPANNYDYLDEFVSTLEPPLSAEERARRERAAYISSGVAHLGNAIGAIGNMVAATGGAPAQKMAEVPDVDTKINAFRQHADKVRNAYLTGLTTREKLRQQDALLRARADRLAFEQARENRMLQAQRLAERKLDWQEKYQQGILDIKAEQQRIDKEYKDGLISLREREAAIKELNAQTARYNANMRWGDKEVVTEKPEKDAFGRPTGNQETTIRRTSHNAANGRSGANGGKKPNPMGGKKKNPMS